MEIKNLLNKEEALNFLKISPATLYNRMKYNNLPYYRIKRKLYFKEKELTPFKNITTGYFPELKELRKKEGLSVRDIEKVIGVSIGTISRLENGKPIKEHHKLKRFFENRSNNREAINKLKEQCRIELLNCIDLNIKKLEAFKEDFTKKELMIDELIKLKNKINY